MARMWMVRGEGGSLYDAFRECGVATEILAALKGKPAPVVEDEAEEVIADPLSDIESQPLERIKDRASIPLAMLDAGSCGASADRALRRHRCRNQTNRAFEAIVLACLSYRCKTCA